MHCPQYCMPVSQIRSARATGLTVSLQVSSVGATGVTSKPVKARRGTSPSPVDSRSETIASTSQHAAHRNPAKVLSRRNRQRTIGALNSSSTAVGDHQPHLHRLQDASTAALRSYTDHQVANVLEPAGHADDTSADVPQSNAGSFRSSHDQGPVEHRSRAELDGSSSAADVQSAQTQEGLARSKHLQHLEAAAAKWRQRSGASSLDSPSQPHVLDSCGISNQTGILDVNLNGLPEAQYWDHASDNMESSSVVTQSAAQDAMSKSEVVLASTRPVHNVPQSPSASAVGIPPPPPRPSKNSQAKTKASWWSALKGDAPPWLL